MPAFPTSTTVLDSILFRDAFGTPRMREVFSRLQPDLALRRGRDRAGEGRGALRRDPGRGGRGDRQAHRRLGARFRPAAPARPISSAIRSCRWCTSSSKQCGEAGRYVHWGATTQDIMDTAVGAAGARGARDHRARHRRAAPHPRRLCAKRYRDTPMAGRTHLQQALPVTFGYKTAIWLAMFDRHAERLAS